MHDIKHPIAPQFFIALIATVGSIAHAAVAEPDLVYLNRCAATCAVHPGTDDAINGASSIVSNSSTLPAFPYADSTFNAMAACVRAVLAPYNVRVRIDSPGSVARREIMLSTTSQTIGYPGGIHSVAPFDGHAHDNRIAFVFASNIGDNMDALCWNTAQSIGFLYGLDRVSNCSDVMSSTPGRGEKAFVDFDSPCSGEISGQAGTCVLGNTTQNSAALLHATPGPSDIVFANGYETFEVPSPGPSP
ncbi:MAG TPA: hypothetical protein VFN13_08310 [Rudaea sp.]|nr:hypothetical protein [Rudaea sp.]